jgi:hypothetical protein
MAIEGFTCMIIFKNMFSFGLTFKAYDWLVANQTNATPVFNPIASVQIVICLTSIPLCRLTTGPVFLFAWRDSNHSTLADIYGKRLRSYFYRHDILALFGVR